MSWFYHCKHLFWSLTECSRNLYSRRRWKPSLASPSPCRHSCGSWCQRASCCCLRSATQSPRAFAARFQASICICRWARRCQRTRKSWAVQTGWDWFRGCSKSWWCKRPWCNSKLRLFQSRDFSICKNIVVIGRQILCNNLVGLLEWKHLRQKHPRHRDQPEACEESERVNECHRNVSERVAFDEVFVEGRQSRR